MSGTRANRTLARFASSSGTKVPFDALNVHAPVAALTSVLPEQPGLTDSGLATFRQSIKFADCVPRRLLTRTIVAKIVDATRASTPERSSSTANGAPSTVSEPAQPDARNSMYEIEMQEMPEDFFPCWKAAGIHLSRQIDGGIQFWLRAHPYPPFLEHPSFRLGNQ